jgi:hypothetical protein
VLDDRRSHSVSSEKYPDSLRLASERGVGRRVVQQDDPHGAVGHGTQASIDRIDLGGGFRIHLPQERLAEVGEVRACEAADEPLRSHDPDLHPVDLTDRRPSLEHRDAALDQKSGHRFVTSGVPVVITEDGDRRQAQIAAAIDEDRGFFGLAVCREITGQQHEVSGVLELSKCLLELGASRLATVDVAGRRDPERGSRSSVPARLHRCEAG